MIKILHRINTKKELVDTKKTYGVEVDIRSHGERLIINHDPFSEGEDFLDWITAYNHKALILNVKEEGLEEIHMFQQRECLIMVLSLKKSKKLG